MDTDTAIADDTLKDCQQKLQEATQKLEKFDNQKSDFVSIAAHELRTPLSAIRWTLQMLLQGDLGEITKQQRTLIEQAHESTKRMVDLVNDLLQADHLEYEDIEYEKSNIDVTHILKDTIEEMEIMAKERKLRLEYKSENTPIHVCGDANKLAEVFTNLISNAIKYTPSGGHISVTTMVSGPQCHISVADNGIGIPKQSQSRLFQKFVRMKNAKKVNADGTGLGLFIVKKIVEAHQGTIEVQSTEGEGTMFTVHLPLVN